MAVQCRNVRGRGGRGASWWIEREVGDVWNGGGCNHGICLRRGTADFGPTVVETVGWCYKGNGDRDFILCHVKANSLSLSLSKFLSLSLSLTLSLTLHVYTFIKTKLALVISLVICVICHHTSWQSAPHGETAFLCRSTTLTHLWYTQRWCMYVSLGFSFQCFLQEDHSHFMSKKTYYCFYKHGASFWI